MYKLLEWPNNYSDCVLDKCRLGEIQDLSCEKLITCLKMEEIQKRWGVTSAYYINIISSKFIEKIESSPLFKNIIWLNHLAQQIMLVNSLLLHFQMAERTTISMRLCMLGFITNLRFVSTSLIPNIWIRKEFWLWLCFSMKVSQVEKHPLGGDQVIVETFDTKSGKCIAATINIAP